jgi:para-nitrobenzyl esterase
MILIVALSVALAGAHPTCPKGEHLVATTLGCVKGDTDGAIERFRGIPYAAPPVGPLRWWAPQPLTPWPDVRDALALGKACPQKPAPWTGALETAEDCLTLNVWTPKRDPKAKLPVMVWIHGGGLAQGSSAQPTYDGRALAERGVVLVSINYRLGALGYFAHPALSAEDDKHHASGNQGLFDQLAALHFVQANAAAFGGDPAHVTIFGESAGAMSVAALLSSPLSKGLFHGAILQSGIFVGPGKSLRPLKGSLEGASESGEEQGQRVAKALGCEGTDALACLRGKTPAELLAAVPPKVGFFGKGEKFGLVVDGVSLTEAPRAAAAKGHVARVPVMVGTTADEGTLFTAPIPLKRPIGLKFLARALFKDDADNVLALYPLEGYSSPHAAFDALVTDAVFNCPSRQDARDLLKVAPRVFRYQFARVPEGSKLGAHHGCELPFVFGTLKPEAPKEEHALAEVVQAYWVAFAKTGDPNHAEATAWTKYSALGDPYLKLDITTEPAAGLRTAQCEAMDKSRPSERETDEERADE